MFKRVTAVFLSILLFSLTVGCNTENKQDVKNGNEVAYTISYFYSYAEDTSYVSQELQKKLDSFGEIKLIEPANPITEIHTEVPQVDNDAKGTDPVAIVLTELELSNYQSYEKEDAETGLSISGACRIVAGMPTDEQIKVYVDSSGKIQQYETVNLGKYDRLDLDEKLIERKCGTFANEVDQVLGTSVFEGSSPIKMQSSSVYMLFSDQQENLVIATDVLLKDDDNPHQSKIKVNLYAVLNAHTG